MWDADSLAGSERSSVLEASIYPPTDSSGGQLEGDTEQTNPSNEGLPPGIAKRSIPLRSPQNGTTADPASSEGMTVRTKNIRPLAPLEGLSNSTTEIPSHEDSGVRRGRRVVDVPPAYSMM